MIGFVLGVAAGVAGTWAWFKFFQGHTAAEALSEIEALAKRKD
jgi:hypothetical protein